MFSKIRIESYVRVNFASLKLKLSLTRTIYNACPLYKKEIFIETFSQSDFLLIKGVINWGIEKMHGKEEVYCANFYYFHEKISNFHGKSVRSYFS